MPIFQKRIAAGADDVEQRGSKMSNASSDLELVFDGGTRQVVGLRFTDIDIPAGAIITSAYIQFQTNSVGSAATILQFRGLAADDLAPFTTAANNLTSRPTTATSVEWRPDSWTLVNEAGAAQRSPDLTAIVQEIIGRSGWQAGYDLGFSISGSGTRNAHAFETSPLKAPLLIVEYTMPGVNAAPTIDLDGSAAGTSYSNTFVKGGSGVPIADVDVTIRDADDTRMEQMTVSLANAKAGDQLLVNGALPDGIVLGAGSTATNLLFTGSASIAAYQTAVGQVRFSNSSETPDTSARSVNVTVGDGQAVSNSAIATIAIDAGPVANAAPAVDLDGSTNGTGFTTIFTPRGAAVPIIDSDALISDADDSALTRATITLASPKTGDALSISGALPAGIVLDPASSATSIILTGSASHAAYKTALQQARFNSDNPNPDATTRQVQVQLSDGQTLSNIAIASIAIDAGERTILEQRINASSDDAEQRGSTMDLISADIELVTDGSTVQLVGLRFTDLQIPVGAVVTKAYIQFTADETYSSVTSLQVRGLAADDAATFTTALNDLSSRATTSASVAWSPAAWAVVNEAGSNQRTTDLTSIVQEIIGRSGWQPGNDLGFTISGSGRRTADAFDGSPLKAPLLHIEYSIPQVSTIDIVLTQDPSLRENVSGAGIGVLSIADPAQGQSYTYSVSDARFTLNGSELRLKEGIRLDFEKSPLVSVKITATDSTGATFFDTVSALIGDVTETRFAAFGDYGNKGGAQSVANLVNSLNVDFIVTMGDNVYGLTPSMDDQIGNKYASYIGNYHGAYGPGSATNRFWPALGNHEYNGEGGGLPAYLDMFTLPGNERYYTFTDGPVQFFVLNSNAAEPDGNSPTSIQGQWLKAGLAASSSPYKIVVLHHAPFSSGDNHGPTPALQWPYEQWGATAVLSGHEHNYERLLRDDNGDGIFMPYLVNGMGGATPVGFSLTPDPTSQMRYAGDYGTILIQASDESITFEFVAVTNGKLIDTFTIDRPASTARLAASEPANAFADAGSDLFAPIDARTRVIDFDNVAWDRLFFKNAPQSGWNQGMGLDAAAGHSHAAWIGRYLDYLGETEQGVVPDVTTTPASNWIVSLG